MSMNDLPGEPGRSRNTSLLSMLTIVDNGTLVWTWGWDRIGCCVENELWEDSSIWMVKFCEDPKVAGLGKADFEDFSGTFSLFPKVKMFSFPAVWKINLSFSNQAWKQFWTDIIFRQSTLFIHCNIFLYQILRLPRNKRGVRELSKRSYSKWTVAYLFRSPCRLYSSIIGDYSQSRPLHSRHFTLCVFSDLVSANSIGIFGRILVDSKATEGARHVEYTFSCAEAGAEKISCGTSNTKPKPFKSWEMKDFVAGRKYFQFRPYWLRSMWIIT